MLKKLPSNRPNSPSYRLLTVRDTILYQAESASTIRTIAAHIKTRLPWRISDGKRHPVKVIKPDGTVVIE